MKLEAIEKSQLTALMSMWRPAGQTYLPAAVQLLQERYDFQSLPSVEQLLKREVLDFQHGNFEGNAFDLEIYNDGIIIRSASNTSYLDALLAEIRAFATEALEFVESRAMPSKLFYESNVVVSMDLNLESELLSSIRSKLTAHQTKYGLQQSDFDLVALSLAVDATAYVGVKPSSFTLARKASVPFNSQIFVSTAPLQTADHLDLLKMIERKMK